VTDTIGSAAQKATTPIIAGGAAAAGLIGGMVLGKRVLGPRRTVLGIPVSRKGLSLQPVAKEVQKAGQQLGRLTDELAQARKQAKKVGDALS
jgi:1-aminocyclopropane-1-carboxylate deaminase/D-cysteine desulfhydrase-like pyridoxal-dependent ACC family enzyme